MNGVMDNWIVLLIYEQRKVRKAQALVDIVVKMTKPEVEWLVQWEWTLYIDGSSNNNDSGVGVILKGPKDMVLEYSLKFEFKEINNQAKYKVLAIKL